MTRLLMLLFLLTTLVLLPFGCGGDDLKFPGSEATATPTAAPGATQTPTQTPTATPTP